MTHQFNQISEHVWWLSPDSATDRPVLGAIAGTRGTLIVDAGASPAHAQVLQEEIAAAGLPAPRYLALTHWHWDHIFGIAVWELPTFGHVETQRKMVELASLDWSHAAVDARVDAGTEIAFCRDMMNLEMPDRSRLVLRAPDIAFTDECVIDLGDVACHLVHVGGDHAGDSTVVYVPADGVVFLGDCIAQNLYHAPPCYTLARVSPLMARLLALQADLYLFGHSPDPIARTELANEAELLRQVGSAVALFDGDRAAVLDALPDLLARAVDEDIIELVDAFIAGSN